MMTVLKRHHNPSYAQGFGVRDQSDAPGLWKGCVGLWASSLGPTGLTLRDQSGFRNHGTLTNMDPATDWVIGGNPRLPGYALGFNSNNKQVVTPLILERPWSVVAWCRLNAGPGSEILFAQGNVPRSVGLMFQNSTTTWIIQDGGSTFDFDWSPDTNWHSVVTTTDTSSRQVYIDGIALSPEAVSGAINPAANNFIIGGRGQATVGWGGQIGFMAAFRRLVSFSEIQQLYDDPDAMLRPRSRVYPAAVAAPPAGLSPWGIHSSGGLSARNRGIMTGGAL